MKHRQTIHIRFDDGTTAELPVTTARRIAFVSLGWDPGYMQAQLDKASKAWDGVEPDPWLEGVRGTEPDHSPEAGEMVHVTKSTTAKPAVDKVQSIPQD